MREVLVSKGSPFEHLDSVVAALGEAVGKADIKGIEDVITPVAQHPSAILELREAEPVAGVELEAESAIGFNSVRSGHEAVEGFLQRVALRQLVGEAEHNIKGGLFRLCVKCRGEKRKITEFSCGNERSSGIQRKSF